jgi:hypothetical protein
MPAKFDRCVRAVKKQKGVNPYAVCHASLGKKIHKDKHDVSKLAENRGLSSQEFEDLYRYDDRTQRWIPKARKTKYNFEKSISKESKHMDKIRKKYKNHKFTKDEVIGYD